MTNGLFSSGPDALGGGALRYRRVPGTRLSRKGKSESEYFLKTPTGQLLVLGERERFLWEAIDHAGTFEALRQEFRSQFDSDIRPDDLLRFIEELVEAGAAEPVPEGEPAPTSSIPGIRKVELPGPDDRDLPGGRRPAAERASPRQGPGAGRRMGGGRLDRAGQGGSGGIRAGLKDLWSRPLGNPEKLFDALVRVFWPLRKGFWLLIPLIVMAFLISVKHRTQYFADWSSLIVSIPQWPCLWLAEHVTTWSARIVEGTVIHAFGGRIKHADVKLFLGIFIRLNFDDSSVKRMTRRQRLWIASSPLIWRLFIFAISMVVWAIYRPAHPLVAQIALFMAFIGLVTFVLSCCPLIPLYGYKFLSVLLDQENLYGRAFRFFSLKIRGLPAPQTMSLAERWGLVFMAAGTAVFTTLYLIHILYTANSYIITHLGGVGGIIGLAILSACALYFVALWRFSAKLRAMHRADRVRDPAQDRPPAPLDA